MQTHLTHADSVLFCRSHARVIPAAHINLPNLICFVSASDVISYTGEQKGGVKRGVNLEPSFICACSRFCFKVKSKLVAH